MRIPVSIVSTFAAIAAIASPIRSDIGDTSTEFDSFVPPQNLWVWPTEIVEPPKSLNPQYVWTPVPFAYYGFIAANGYCQKGRNPLGSFTEDSFTARYSSGYSLGVFVPLDLGEYHLSYDCDENNIVSLVFYKITHGGFIYDSLIHNTIVPAGLNKVEFVVPEDSGLILVTIKPRNNSVPPTTVTNIELYRLD